MNDQDKSDANFTNKSTVESFIQNQPFKYGSYQFSIKQKIANNEFVEWEEVYKDNFYGTLKTEIERIWKKGEHIIFDMDVEGGLNLKKQFGEQALAIFVMPPSIEHLEARLRQRETETPESIARRIGKAEHELKQGILFDTIILL